MDRLYFDKEYNLFVLTNKLLWFQVKVYFNVKLERDIEQRPYISRLSYIIPQHFALFKFNFQEFPSRFSGNRGEKYKIVLLKSSFKT